MKYIAITQRVQVLSDIQERRDALSQEWASLADSCGFLPLLLPNQLPIVKKMLDEFSISGILFSGGNDLFAYGGDAPERDEVEHFLIEYSITHKIPLLGICRGMQILLDHFGIPLIPVKNHIRVEHGLNNGDIVNSYHNFGITCCDPVFEVKYISTDGIIEGVVHKQYNWIQGIMWHPERYKIFRQHDIEMIKELFLL